MKKFVILSDSHGRRGAIDRVSHLFEENDYLIHLGDGSFDMRPVFSKYPEKTFILRGNCDFSYGEEEIVIDAGTMSVFCCHGHRYGVKRGLHALAAAARAHDCEIALYGHTHRGDVSTVDGVLCVCPGAIGDYAEPSYAYLVVCGGKATATVVPL